jgi:hypothetical protein
MNKMVRQKFFMTAEQKKRLKSRAANVDHFPMFPRLERAY